MFRNFTIQLTALALIVATMACSLGATPEPTLTPLPTATPEPTDTPKPSATPEPSATFTATPKPTNTPRPTNTATPVPQPGDVLMSDTFDNEANNWKDLAGTKARVQINNGEMSFLVRDRSVFYFTNPAGRFTDVDVTVEATLAEGTGQNSMFGGQCRKRDDSNYYLFAVTGNGYYAVVKYVKGEWQALVDWTRTSAIKTGKATNTLRYICEGQGLQFWINGVRLVTLKDTEFKNGQLGLVVGTFDATTPNTEVIFDNFSATFPEPITLATGGGGGTGGTGGGGTVATQAPVATASGTGQLIIVMCQGLEVTVTIFKDGQIVQQHSLHNAGRNVYELPPGHYDVQFNATGYYNLNLAYDIVAGAGITQYIGDSSC
jgi:hypothetical protein